MNFDSEKLFSWSWRLSLVVSGLVVLLSFNSGVLTGTLVIRGFVSFLSIYALTYSSLVLFNRYNPDWKEDVANGQARGVYLDLAVGNDTDGLPDLTGNSHELPVSGYVAQTRLPGQVEPSLATGLTDDKRQAEIVRRMGWGEP
ncbi:MAG: hypothetical protein M0T74_15850 [Desulfitobacterium hafniense]|nr:hypothetical protein [Desulfitobacterium hafniense]